MKKSRIKRIYRRARDIGRGIASGMKGDLAAAGGGVAAQLIRRNFMIPADGETSWFTDNWWATGLALIVGGSIVRRFVKLGGLGQSLGHGLCGAGGYALAEGYYADEKPADAGVVVGRRPWADAGAVVERVFEAPALEAAGPVAFEGVPYGMPAYAY